VVCIKGVVQILKYHFILKGHCKSLAPIWEEVGMKFAENSNVKICKVDCTVHRELCKRQGIDGYPTLLFFHNGQVVQKYTEKRKLDTLVGFVQALVDSLLTKQLDHETNKLDDKPLDKESEDGAEGVLELNHGNFATLLSKPGLLFVKFYAPWCGHCQRLAPVWINLAKKFEQNALVTIAEVDCTVSAELCMNNNINYYPTLVLFQNGQKSKEFSSFRDLETLEGFLNENLKTHEEL